MATSTSVRRGVKVQSKITNISKPGVLEDEVAKKRRSLKVLQYSSTSNSLTSRISEDEPKKKGTKRVLKNQSEKSSKKRIVPHIGQIAIFQDEDSCRNEVNGECNTTDNEAELLTGPVTETYWEEIAERRRVALQETLIENEQLHAENGLLKAENAELKEENGKLAEMASQAEYLASVLQKLADDDPVQESDTLETSDSPTKHSENNELSSDKDDQDDECEQDIELYG